MRALPRRREGPRAPEGGRGEGDRLRDVPRVRPRPEIAGVHRLPRKASRPGGARRGPRARERGVLRLPRGPRLTGDRAEGVHDVPRGRSDASRRGGDPRRQRRRGRVPRLSQGARAGARGSLRLRHLPREPQRRRRRAWRHSRMDGRRRRSARAERPPAGGSRLVPHVSQAARFRCGRREDVHRLPRAKADPRRVARAGAHGLLELPRAARTEVVRGFIVPVVSRGHPRRPPGRRSLVRRVSHAARR